MPDNNSYSAQSNLDQKKNPKKLSPKDKEYFDPTNQHLGEEINSSPGGNTSTTNAYENNPGQSPDDFTFGIDSSEESDDESINSTKWRTNPGIPQITPRDNSGVNKEIISGVSGNRESKGNKSYEFVDIEDGESGAIDLKTNQLRSNDSVKDSETLIEGDRIYNDPNIGQINDQDKQRSDVENVPDQGFSQTAKEPDMSINNDGDFDDDTTGRLDISG